MYTIGNNTYEEVIKPLDEVIVIIFEQSLAKELLSIQKAYKKDLNTNENASQEINKQLNFAMKNVLKSLSKSYRKKLKMFFSRDGLILYVHSRLKQSSRLLLMNKE